MIEKWSKRNLVNELEYVRDGENLFVDKEVKLVTTSLQSQLI